MLFLWWSVCVSMASVRVAMIVMRVAMTAVDMSIRVAHNLLNIIEINPLFLQRRVTSTNWLLIGRPGPLVGRIGFSFMSVSMSPVCVSMAPVRVAMTSGYAEWEAPEDD